MASGAVAGRYADITIAATSTSAATALAEAQSWEVNVNQDLIDATSFDSGGNADFIPGRRSFTVRIGALYVSSDADQNVLREALSSGATRWVSLYPTTAAGTRWQGTVFTQTYSVGAGGDNDPHLFNVTLQSRGGLVYTSGAST